MDLTRHRSDIDRALRREQFQQKGDGIITLFHDALVVRGGYIEGVNGKDFRYHPNLIVDQGIRHFLNVTLAGASQITHWYLAPFSGATTPAANWTATNFASNASEITSDTEGFAEATRQECTFATTTSADQIDNYAAKAALTVVTASSLNVLGLGLLSVSTRGSTSGTLLSAGKFTATRVLQDTDVWNAGYRVTLAGS